MAGTLAPTAPAAAERHSHAGPDGEVDWLKVYLGFAGMIVGQFMAVLDIQIVASSLSQIQAGIGASADEISWVQTIYLLAEVIIIPLTAYLTKMWGTRVCYVVAAAAFVVTSIMTGLSTSIEAMIVTRALQGLAAGAMIPAVFATAMTVFPPEKRVMSGVLVGMIVTLAPTIGPTLGGFITDTLSWRWLFFINVPAGALVIFLVGRYGGFDKGDPALAKGIDWFGLATMTLFLLTMQYVLEEGAGDSWFKDGTILWLTVTAVVSGTVFVWRQLTYKQPIVSLAPFVNRNFTLGIAMSFAAGISMFGGTFLIPLYLAQVLRYSAWDVGVTLLVSGLTMFFSAPIAGRLVRMMDLRISMIGGFLLAGWGMLLGAQVNVNWSFNEFALMQATRGFGIMMAMIASQQLTVSTLPVHMMKDASGLVNLIRNVGGAMGLAMLTTVLGVETARHYSELAAAVPTGGYGQDMLEGLTALMQERQVSDPEGAARKAMGMMLRRDAAVLGYADAFVFLSFGSFAAGALAIFTGRVRLDDAQAPKPGGH
jgi:DHA2 family multidrug resistance protein